MAAFRAFNLGARHESGVEGERRRLTKVGSNAVPAPHPLRFGLSKDFNRSLPLTAPEKNRITPPATGLEMKEGGCYISPVTIGNYYIIDDKTGKYYLASCPTAMGGKVEITRLI